MFKELAYTVLGAAISGYTYYITTTVETKPAMYIFFFIGFALIAYSVFSILTTYITGGAEVSEDDATQGIVRCPSCGVKHYQTSNYCHKCGAEL